MVPDPMKVFSLVEEHKNKQMITIDLDDCHGERETEYSGNLLNEANGVM